MKHSFNQALTKAVEIKESYTPLLKVGGLCSHTKKNIRLFYLALIAVSVFSTGIYAQDSEADDKKEKKEKKEKRADLENWSEEKIKQWEDSVKQALFPQPVVESLEAGTQPRMASKANAMAQVSSTNSYVPDFVNIDLSKSVGEITISQSISPSGATTYAVPIDIYQSPNGFQPQVVLGYNSQGGNSAMGMGWNLGGVSAITRVPQNQHYDNKTDGITMYGQNTAFVLDGMRLIKISGTSNQIRYESEQENIKAVAYVDDSVIEYFEVFYPNGNVGIFGYTNNTTATLTYPLTNLTDMRNNSINFTYSYTNNRYSLTKITYGQASCASVELQYQTGRNDAIVGYQAGLKVIEDRLLSAITCKFGSTILRTYSLEYITQKNTSLLNKINCSTGSASLNPLIFYYGENNTANTFSETQSQLLEWYVFTNPAQVILDKGKFDYGSQDDGLISYPYNEPYWYHQRSSNLFRHSQAQYQNLFSGTEKIFLYTGLSDPLAYPMPNLTTGVDFIKIFCANTDGKDEEEVVKINNGVSGSYDQVVFNVYSPNLYTGLAHKYTRTFNFSTVLTDADGLKSIHPKFYYSGDFNGDGKMEVLAVSSHNPIGSSLTSKCYLFDLEANTKLFEGYVFPYIVNFVGTNQSDAEAAYQNTDRLYPMDYNGDGKTDICLINDQGINIYTFNISGSTYAMSLVATYTGLKKANLDGKQLMLGEFNGDGKPDFLLSPTTLASDWNIFYSMGNGQFETSSYTRYSYSNDKYLLQDVNSDGLTDLISSNSAGFITYLAVSGRGFNVESVIYCDNSNTKFTPTNINSRNYFNQIVTLENNGIASLYSFPRNDNKERMLTGAVNSLGLVTKNYYAQLNEGAQYSSQPLYTKGYGAVYPYENFQGGLTVTGKTELYHNGQLTGSTSTSYTNAVLHKLGLGFTGFGSITTTDNIRYRNSSQVFNPYNYGIRVSDDSPVAGNTYNYTVSVQSNKKVNILLNNVTSTDKLKGNTITSTYVYDSYGNPTSETVNYGVAISTTTNTYYNNTNDVGFLLGFLISKTETTNRGSDSWTTVTSVPEYSNGLPKKVYQYVNSNLVSTESYGYDSNWNLLNKTIQKYNSSKSFITSYEYDVYKRLTKETDPMGFYNTYQYEASTGRLTSTQNHKSQDTTYTYDALGRTTGKAYPDGTSESTSLSWESGNSGGVNGRYGVQTSVTGKPTSKTCYDALNRETRRSFTRFDGTVTNTDLQYDAYGRLEKTSLHFKGSYPSYWNTNAYDAYDRLTSVTAASGKITTQSFNANSINTTDEGISSTKTYDVQGNLVSVTDQGGTVTYNLRPDGQPNSIVAPGGVTTGFGYDTYGRQTSITDPSAGLQTYAYDVQGNLNSTTDANGKTITTIFDQYGRPTNVTRPEFNTTYTYNTDGLLTSESSTNGTSKTYSYDSFGRVTSDMESCGVNLQHNYTYSVGNLVSKTTTVNSGNTATENYTYSYGYLTEIKLNGQTSIWKLTEENVQGQATKAQTGPLARTYEYTEYGMPTRRTAGAIQDFSYNFSVQSGNLLSRTDNKRNITESFQYDNLNRLSVVGGNDIVYAANGNITQLPGTGTLTYGNSAKPYQVTMLTPTGTAVPARNQNVTYTSFQRPAQITEGTKAAEFTYNANGDRVYTYFSDEANNYYSQHYLLNNEYEMWDGNDAWAKEILYLGGDAYSAPAVLVIPELDNPWEIYYICRDYLGSITHVVKADGSLKQELSYDAWGRLRNPANQVAYFPSPQGEGSGGEVTLFLGRGYTGHEHLQQFGLINMNARLYDPALGRFLSPDPYVQAPDFTQNFNRYSYCLNNPLKYVDPDGEIVWFIPVIYFAVYAAIEYGTQVYHNYQASNQMVALGYDPMTTKDKWLGRIDWFDVAISGAAGAISSIAPPLAPWIMYGTPLLTNAVNVYGDGKIQNVFDGSIPIGQYAFNSLVDIGSLYATNVIKTGLATPNKDIWNPSNHTRFFTKEVFGKEITGRSVEDLLQQGVASWMDYSIKATKYPEFNPDRLYKDGIPSIPSTPINLPNNSEFPRKNKFQNIETEKDLENYFRLKIIHVR